jgi:N utilization substance protein B
MISRHYLRTKVLQAIYAHEMNPMEDMVAGEKKLVQSIENCYTLFLSLFSLIPEFKRYRINKIEDAKTKFHPTTEDLNPNTKFINNAVIAQIENNAELQKRCTNHHISWNNDLDIIAQIFQEITALKEYEVYMANETQSYEEDKCMILTIIEKVFAVSTLLHWFFSSKNLHWSDDYNEALLMLHKNIFFFKEQKGNSCKILPLFKSENDDVDFYKSLYRKTLLNDTAFGELIEAQLKNWEADRVWGIDMILMKMALCELTQFPTIPIKVTLNEYIELAKWYSSVKSGLFVNGLLDKVIIELKSQNRIHKTGLGLID